MDLFSDDLTSEEMPTSRDLERFAEEGGAEELGFLGEIMFAAMSRRSVAKFLEPRDNERSSRRRSVDTVLTDDTLKTIRNIERRTITEYQSSAQTSGGLSPRATTTAATMSTAPSTSSKTASSSTSSTSKTAPSSTSTTAASISKGGHLAPPPAKSLHHIAASTPAIQLSPSTSSSSSSSSSSSKAPGERDDNKPGDGESISASASAPASASVSVSGRYRARSVESRAVGQVRRRDPEVPSAAASEPATASSLRESVGGNAGGTGGGGGGATTLVRQSGNMRLIELPSEEVDLEGNLMMLQRPQQPGQAPLEPVNHLSEAFSCLKCYFSEFSSPFSVFTSKNDTQADYRSYSVITNPDLLARSQHFMLFASAALGIMLLGLQLKKRFFNLWERNEQALPTKHEKVVFDHTGIAREDLICGSWPMVSKFSFLPGYFLAIDHKFKSVVLALRSSTTHRDWLTDLCGSYEPFFTGFAHRGMLYSTHLVKEKLDAMVIETLQKYPGYQFVVTGHSLGAGVASLYTILFHEEHPLVPIHCYAYACPCTVSPDLALKYSSIVTSYVLANDIVPRLSLGSLESLRDASNYRVQKKEQKKADAAANKLANMKVKSEGKSSGFSFFKGKKEKKFDVTITTTDSDLKSRDRLESSYEGLGDSSGLDSSTPSLEDSSKRLERSGGVKANFAYPCTFGHMHYYMHNRLVPPGTILHLIPERGTVVCEKACFGCFTSINFSPGLFWSHLPSCYEEALATIASPFQ